MSRDLRTIINDAALCLSFFTRLPVQGRPGVDRAFASTLWAAPLIGWLVALLGGLAFGLTQLMGLSSGPSAAIALVVMLFATGCLHEDGLADTADAFGGGATRERVLEIMRDSRIGSYGAAALILSILLRWTAIADLGGFFAVLAGLIAAHGGSRALLPLFLRAVPPARTDGLGRGIGVVEQQTANIALALGVASLFFLGFFGAVAAACYLAVAFFVFCALCRQKIGGQTGDTAGAMQQIAEILILLAASAVY